jgi:hypothetical protein
MEHDDVPVWLVELHVNTEAEHPAMSFQVVPPFAELWKATVPDGVVASLPGRETETVAV